MTKPVMKMLPAMLSALIIAVAVNTASAAQMTVGDLQEICIAHDEGSKNACKFYILGVTEGTSVAAGVANDKAHFCIPEGVSASAMELVVKMAIGQDLMVFPADRDIPAVSFVAAAMQKAFPCSL